MQIRAAVLEEFGRPLVVQEVGLDGPGPGEVLVRLAACGVCHTDMYTAGGADPSGYAPTVLGHEGAGVVEKVGADATLAEDEPLPRDPRAAEHAAEQGRRAAAPLHGHVHVRGVHRDPRDRAREGQPGRAARGCGAVCLRPLYPAASRCRSWSTVGSPGRSTCSRSSRHELALDDIDRGFELLEAQDGIRSVIRFA
jgi:hypothetical protein